MLPGNGEGSKHVLRMRVGKMPPAGLGVPPMPEFALDLIADFIDGLAPADAGQR